MRRALLAGVFAVLVLPATVQAQLGDRLRINGYSSMEFEYMTSDDGRGDPNGSFDADLFDLVFNFRPVDRLRIAADITWERLEPWREALAEYLQSIGEFRRTVEN